MKLNGAHLVWSMQLVLAMDRIFFFLCFCPCIHQWFLALTQVFRTRSAFFILGPDYIADLSCVRLWICMMWIYFQSGPFYVPLGSCTSCLSLHFKSCYMRKHGYKTSSLWFFKEKRVLWRAERNGAIRCVWSSLFMTYVCYWSRLCFLFPIFCGLKQ